MLRRFTLSYRDVETKRIMAPTAKAAVREALYSSTVPDDFRVIEVRAEDPAMAMARVNVTMPLSDIAFFVKVPFLVQQSVLKASEREALADFLFNRNLPDVVDFQKLTITAEPLETIRPDVAELPVEAPMDLSGLPSNDAPPDFDDTPPIDLPEVDPAPQRLTPSASSLKKVRH